MILDDWQKEFLNTKGDKILCTGRQIGKTEICAQDAGDYALLNKNKTILMIAPVERQAFELFQRTLTYLAQKAPLKIVTKGKNRPTKSKLHLKNGTRILCLPAGTSGIGIRGYVIDRLYADEASRVPDEVWTAVTPMLLTTGGDIIMLSTPWGKQGYFWETYDKDDTFTKFHKNSEEVMRNRPISDSWTQEQRDKALKMLEREKVRKTKLQYGQEYLGLFVDELMRLFTDELINKCCILSPSPPITPSSDFSGQVENPVVAGRDYFLGVDVARMGGDETVFAILDRTDKKKIVQVDNIIAVDNRITDTTREIIRYNRQYDFRKIYIDTGGMGVGVFDPLLEHEETRRKVVSIDNAKLSLDPEDAQKKKLMKESLYMNLLHLMENGNIKLIDKPEIKQSLKSIQLEYTDTGKLRIFGRYDHIAEAIIRAARCSKDKSLNLFIM